MSDFRSTDKASDARDVATDLDAAVDRGFAGLDRVGPILLAVSGGPDSMALTHLAHRWAHRLATRPALYVATVDHGLRLEARDEAAMVAEASAERGLPHAVLTWRGPKPQSRLQEAAREARYALLGEHARRVGATHILTAHHADDQAETVLFRLGRGSGVGGLAGMRRLTPLAPDLWLGRPLLEMTKADLVGICRLHSIRFVDDPSNRDPAFARTLLRDQRAVLAQLGLDVPGMTRLARRMARADAALEAEAQRVESALHREYTAEGCDVDLAPAAAAPPEIAVRLLRRVVAPVANADRAIRLDRLEALADAVWVALRAGAPHRATLAGTRLVLDARGHLDVRRESVRRRGRTPSKPSTDRPD